MTSVLAPWLTSTAAPEYAAVAPTSPEADATFIESFSYHPRDRTVLSESTRGGKHKSKSSYSNEDFEGTQKKMATSSNRTWNDTAFEVGQWTTLAAGTVASSILSTTQHISSQLQNTDPCSRSASKVTFRSQDAHHSKTFGRGIDRDYLKGSPHHPTVQQRSFIGYFGDLAARFTAPKIETGKAKWIE